MSTTLDTPAATTPDPAPSPPEQGPRAPRSTWATVAFIVSVVLVVVFVAGAWFRLRDESGGSAMRAEIASGKRPVAPALPTTGIAGDGAPGIEGLTDGRVRVVNHWASWCAPCIEEAPALRDVAEEYKGRVDFVGINAGNEDLKSKARAFVRDHNVDFSIVRGDRGDKLAWGVQSFPESFIVGTDGKISYQILGAVDAEELRDFLDRELGKQRERTAS